VVLGEGTNLVESGAILDEIGHVAHERQTLRGGLNWSAQHSNLLAKMECGHETATSHLLLGRSAVRDL
jgi:hypothetical protein